MWKEECMWKEGCMWPTYEEPNGPLPVDDGEDCVGVQGELVHPHQAFYPGPVQVLGPEIGQQAPKSVGNPPE
jgi:hypothetical protein